MCTLQRKLQAALLLQITLVRKSMLTETYYKEKAKFGSKEGLQATRGLISRTSL